MSKLNWQLLLFISKYKIVGLISLKRSSYQNIPFCFHSFGEKSGNFKCKKSEMPMSNVLHFYCQLYFSKMQISMPNTCINPIFLFRNFWVQFCVWIFVYFLSVLNSSYFCFVVISFPQWEILERLSCFALIWLQFEVRFETNFAVVSFTFWLPHFWHFAVRKLFLI